MPTPTQNTEKTALQPMNLRHTSGVKAFVDEKAAENNEFPSTFYRRIFNAGLEAMYGIKLHNNQIVSPPR
ncbi:MAG: hypothetical protein ACXWAT_02020 [Methylobacter sp.]